MNAPYTAASTQQPAAICALKTPADAIHILEAVRMGLVPRVTRRLTGHERSMIRPGTVWVWEEEETNMRRWTDGRRWGASRVGGGGFLVYTESSESHSPPPQPGYGQNGYFQPRKNESLIKQTYSTTMTQPETGKVKKFHVVAYSSKYNPQGDAHNPLPLPHQLPLLAALKVTPGIWPEWEHQRTNETQRRAPGSTVSPGPLPSPSNPSSSYARLPPPPPHHTEYPLLSPSIPRTDYPPPSMAYDRRIPAPMLSPGLTPSGSQIHPGAPGPSSTPNHVPMPSSIPYPPQPQYPDRYYPYPPRGYPVTPTEPYYDDRRERSPNRAYAQPYPYYPRDRYEEQPQPVYTPGYAPPIPPTMHDHRYPEYPPSHAPPNPSVPPPHRQSSGPKLPPTPSSSTSLPDLANQATLQGQSQNQGQFQSMPQGTAAGATRQSPKLSISNALLNPEADSSGMPLQGGLTLPPLRMVDGEGQSQAGANGMNGPNAINGALANGNATGKKSPTMERDGFNLGEDARQLGELGRRVA